MNSNIMSSRPMPRGILGAVRAELDPGTVLAELNRSVTDFKNDQGRRLEAVESAIDKLATRQAGMIAAVGPALPTDRNSRDLQTLAKFARSGEENLTNFVNQNRPRADMSIASNPDGGFVALPEVDKSVQAIARDASVIRGLSSVVTINGTAYEKVISYGLPAAGWVGERDPRTTMAGVTLKKLSFPVNEMFAMPAITQSLLDDGFIDLGAHLSQQIGTAFAIKEDLSFAGGTSPLEPQGFLSYPLATDDDFAADGSPIRAYGNVQYVPTGASGTATTSDQWVTALVDTSFKLRAPYRNARTCWMMNRNTAAIIRGIKDSTGRLLWDADSGRIANGAPPQLLGFNVVISESMPDVAASSVPIILSDMLQFYVVVDRIGIRVIRDALTSKPFVLFYTTKRVGGGIQDFNAAKYIRCSTS